MVGFHFSNSRNCNYFAGWLNRSNKLEIIGCSTLPFFFLLIISVLENRVTLYSAFISSEICLKISAIARSLAFYLQLLKT